MLLHTFANAQISIDLKEGESGHNQPGKDSTDFNQPGKGPGQKKEK